MPYTSAALNTAIDRLNPAQRQAVETTEGPVLVFAGPGTGKTQILTTRIGTLLDQGISPGNILALTFTNAGAKNMQERLAGLVGPAAYQVTMSTFHSFASGVIDQYAHLFQGTTLQGGLIADLDQYEVVRSILEAHDFEMIKPSGDPLYYLRSCVSLITSYKREGVSPQQVQQLAQEVIDTLESFEGPARERAKSEKAAQKNLELAVVYEEYQTALRERGLYDYEDLILWVRDALRTQPELLLEYQERYQYILVDEFQDTNQAQFQLLVELCSFWGAQANIFVVGDPNQSIYRFQGASVSNVLQFLQLFPQAKVITLTQGYRCPPEIYDRASQVITHNALTDLDPRLQELEKPLRAMSDSPPHPAVQVQKAANPLAEALWIGAQLQAHHDQGTPWREMAVLYRKHGHSDTLESTLRSLGIPVVAQRGENSLEQPLVQGVLQMIRLIVSLRRSEDATLWDSFLFLPWWNLPAGDILRVIRAARTLPEAEGSVWWILEHPEVWPGLGVTQQDAWQKLHDKLVEWHEELHSTVAESLEQVLAESGVFRLLWSDAKWRAQLPALLSLLREAHQWSRSNPTARFAEFVARLEAMQRHEFALVPEYVTADLDAVTLCTAHSAKGREWEYVYLLRMNDTVWSNTKDPNRIPPLPNVIPYAETSAKEKMEDDRRLFYVALSRAKQQVTLISCEQVVERAKVRELLLSPFVLELGEGVRTDTIPNPEESQLQKLTRPVLAEYLIGLDRAWLMSLVQEFALSFSALDSYLKCPGEFFFQYLVRTPTAPDIRQVVGQAVHLALERVNRTYQQSNEFLDSATVQRIVHDRIRHASLTLSDRAKAEKESLSLLVPYLQAHKAEWPKSLRVEHFFGTSPPLQFEGLSLVGKVDNIIPTGAHERSVCVIDYKTGRRKTQGELLGKPDDVRQPVQQLVFYALLAELDPTFQYTVTEGEFAFLRPTEAGKYKPVRFEITSERSEALKATLRQVRDEIHSLSFLDHAPCGECGVCDHFGFAAPLRDQD